MRTSSSQLAINGTEASQASDRSRPHLLLQDIVETERTGSSHFEKKREVMSALVHATGIEGRQGTRLTSAQDVGASTSEESARALASDDDSEGIERRLVLDDFPRRLQAKEEAANQHPGRPLQGASKTDHHHATADGVKREGYEACEGDDSPAEGEGGKERALKGTLDEHRLEAVVETEGGAAVDDDADDGELRRVSKCEPIAIRGGRGR